jgi:hypothetical protein
MNGQYRFGGCLPDEPVIADGGRQFASFHPEQLLPPPAHLSQPGKEYRQESA